MQQILAIWRGLTNGRKLIVLGSTIAVFAALLGMSRLATNPRLTLLYSGLDAAAAGEIVEVLQQSGVAFDVRGTSVFVPETMRDQLRLTLASEGLPASAGQGYELLDNLSGFGTTSQMFDAAYLRAKEGELARTIVSSPQVATARVHIASGSDNPFRRDLAPSASVHVAGPSGVVSKAQAQAIRHLVASAVTGLTPHDVSIVDALGGLLDAKSEIAGFANDQERSDLLRERVLRLIEARVGRGNAVVEISIDAVKDTESITEHSFDPNSRFVISSDTEERSDQSQNAGSGAVTVASNLPDGDANGADTETSQTAESRERLNYEVSQTTRELIKAPGAIKRLTVAVLLNGKTEINTQGSEVFVPLDDAELTALRDLVASAVGFNEARGDLITLKSMQFEASEIVGSLPAKTQWFAGNIDTMSLIQIVVLTLVVLVLGLFVLRPILLSSRLESGSDSLDLLPKADRVVVEPAAISGTIEPDGTELSLPALATVSSSNGLPSTEDAVSRLKALIEERQSETVEVLRSWLDEPKTGVPK